MGKTLLALFSLPFIVLATTTATLTNANRSSSTAAAFHAPSHNQSASFIVSACHHTAHPRICSRILAPYARVVGTSVRRLGYAAVKVAAKRGRDAAAFATRLIRCQSSPGTTPSIPSPNTDVDPMQGCAEYLGFCAEQLRLSAREMRHLGLSFGSTSDDAKKGEGSDEFNMRMNNVHLWIRAAFDCQNGCVSELSDSTFDGDPIATALSKNVFRAYLFTGVALDLFDQILFGAR